eukprot:403353844
MVENMTFYDEAPSVENEFQQIQQNDPNGGYRIIYERDVPVDLRITEQRILQMVGQDVGSREVLTFKILIKGPESNPHSLKIELFSNQDYFFLYKHLIDLASFDELKKNLKLKINFPDYATMLIKMLNNCIKDQQNFQCVKALHSDGNSELSFTQNIEYRKIELFRCNFQIVEEEIVKKHVSYRYQLSSFKNKLTQQRLNDLSKIIKLKNPSLLQQMQKGAQLTQSKAYLRTSQQQYTYQSSVQQQSQQIQQQQSHSQQRSTQKPKNI